MKTLEEIENNYRSLVYGSCNCCKKDFKYGEDGHEIRSFRCGSSQGQPDIFHVGEIIKMCDSCFTDLCGKV